MASFEWNDELLTGIAKLDKQHRTLFKKVNHLLDACAEGRGREEVAGMLDYLSGYSREHFTLEERLMRVNRYPAAGAHRIEHQRFFAGITALQRELTANGAGPHLVVLTNRVISTWLTDHVRRTDSDLAAFLRSRAPSQSETYSL